MSRGKRMASNSERFRVKAGSHLLLMKNGRIFMLRRAGTGYGDGMYALIAGHLDPRETMRENIIREAREEVGIGIRKNDLKLLHVMHKIGRAEHGLLIFYWTTKRWTGTPENREPSKCSGTGWFDQNHLPKNTLPQTRFALSEIKAGRTYSEYRKW